MWKNIQENKVLEEWYTYKSLFLWDFLRYPYYTLYNARCGSDTLHQELLNKDTSYGQLDSMENSSPNSEGHTEVYR